MEELEEWVHQLDRLAIGQDAALPGPLKLPIAHELANRLVVPEIGDFCLALRVRERFPFSDRLKCVSSISTMPYGLCSVRLFVNLRNLCRIHC